MFAAKPSDWIRDRPKNPVLQLDFRVFQFWLLLKQCQSESLKSFILSSMFWSSILNSSYCNNISHPFMCCYFYLPQHFLYLRPEPQGQGSFLPIFWSARTYGFFSMVPSDEPPDADVGLATCRYGPPVDGMLHSFDK